jgi:hypothetical protein
LFVPKQMKCRACAISFATWLSFTGCGDDSAMAEDSGSASATETTTGGTTESSPVTLTTAVSVDETGRTESSTGDSTGESVTDTGLTTGPDTDGTTDTDTDDTTGDPPARPGQSAGQLVSAGTRSSSASYTVVFTVGQPSKLQSTHDSASYRLQGGLIGANGSPP